jgi:hypothetical protein
LSRCLDVSAQPFDAAEQGAIDSTPIFGNRDFLN